MARVFEINGSWPPPGYLGHSTTSSTRTTAATMDTIREKLAKVITLGKTKA
jgi:hypothetical protein